MDSASDLKHQDSDCTECTYVQDKENLLLHFVKPSVRNQAKYKPLFVGKFNMSGWTGHSSFYLFKCRECESVVVDYPHGYREGYLYLRCNSCRQEIILTSKKYREIYVRDNLHIPKVFSLWDVLKLFFIRPKKNLNHTSACVPLNIEDQEALKVKPDTIIPSDLES